MKTYYCSYAVPVSVLFCTKKIVFIVGEYCPGNDDLEEITPSVHPIAENNSFDETDVTSSTTGIETTMETEQEEETHSDGQHITGML